MQIYLFKNYKKILIFGERNSEKSTLVNKLKNGTFSKLSEEENNEDIIFTKLFCSLFDNKTKKKNDLYLTTYEIEINDNIIDDKKWLLSPLFFESYCALFLVDLTSNLQLKNVSKLLETIDNLKNKNNNCQKIVVFTKNDLIEDKKILDFEISSFTEQHKNLKTISISCVDKSEDFIKLLELLFHTINEADNKYATSKVTLPLVRKGKGNLGFNDIEQQIRIVLVGDSGTGKTCFFKMFFNGLFQSELLITVGIENEKFVALYKTKYFYVTLWDTAGQERFRSLPKSYYNNADGIILLFSVNDYESFLNVKNWTKYLKEYTQNNPKLFLVGNKIDLNEGFLTQEEINKKTEEQFDDSSISSIDKIFKKQNHRQITREEAEDLAKSLSMKYFETSCKYNINIDELLCNMILDISEKYKIKEKGVGLDDTESNKKKGCC